MVLAGAGAFLAWGCVVVARGDDWHWATLGYAILFSGIAYATCRVARYTEEYANKYENRRFTAY
jgi:hypothetical protein